MAVETCDVITIAVFQIDSPDAHYLVIDNVSDLETEDGFLFY